MAVTGYKTPFLGSVSVGTTAASQDIYTLLSAIFTNLPHKCCYLTVQSDTTNGSASLYVGNSNVSASMCGANLAANQSKEIFAFDSNLAVLDHVFLLSSSGTIQANITVVTR